MKLIFRKQDCYKPAGMAESFFWNIFGSSISAVVSFLFSVIVARICLPFQSDVFSIAYALGTQIWTIGNFETGTLQVTDSKDKYSPSNYFYLKILLCSIAVLTSLVIIAVNMCVQSYDFYKSLVVFLFCVYKIFDAFSNYYYAVFQKNEHINIGGFSMGVRTLLNVVVFFLSLWFSKSLPIAIFLMTVNSVLWICLYEKRLSNCFGKTKFDLNKKTFISMVWDCLPLFLSSFLLAYLINAPKYAIDSVVVNNAGIQTAYNALFQPAAIINMFCLFIFRPMLTTLSKQFNDNKNKQFLKTIIRISSVTLLFSVFAVVFAAIIGIPVFQMIYGKEYILDSYLWVLLLIIIGGAFYAFSQLLYNVITVIRCQHYLLIGYGIDLIISISLANYAVRKNGILGAAMIYSFSMLLLFILFLIIFLIKFSSLKRRA